MKKILLLFYLFVPGKFLFAQTDVKTILSKSLQQCKTIDRGSYYLTIKGKSFRDKDASETGAKCFFAPRADSLFRWKFFIEENNGDRMICAETMMIRMQAADSTASIYQLRDYPNMFSSAGQTEGLFPPFFTADDVFSAARWKESTFIIRQIQDKTVDGKSCYQVQLIDVSRTSQRKEKLLCIDKQSMIPLEYSEKSVIKIEKDSLIKQTTYSLSSFNTAMPPDSLFSYDNVPSWFRMQNVLSDFYHHHLKTGTEAPYFKARTIKGPVFSVPQTGQSCLLFFMNLSSYPALKALKDLHELREHFKNIDIVLVAANTGPKALNDLVARRKISLISIADTLGIAARYYINVSPTFMVVNASGTITMIETGYNEQTAAKLRETLEEMGK